MCGKDAGERDEGQPQVTPTKEGTVCWKGSTNLRARFRAVRDFCQGAAVPVFGLLAKNVRMSVFLSKKPPVFLVSSLSSSQVPVPQP